jgi:glycosyltransferase involved in cell wall biosynthesis
VERLTVVLPVFNEEGQIDDTIAAWTSVLRRLNVSFELHVYDDGSRDRTPARLDALAHDTPELRVIHKENSGHGPTLLRGYREASTDWVFQADSDGEIEPDEFAALWERRDGQDLVIGRRVREQTVFFRKVVSFIAALTVRLLFGPGIRDVNVPFRLFRRSSFAPFLSDLPEGMLTPNVAMAGWAIRRRLHIREQPVRFVFEKRRKSTLDYRRLFRFSCRAFVQVLTFRFR